MAIRRVCALITTSIKQPHPLFLHLPAAAKRHVNNQEPQFRAIDFPGSPVNMAEQQPELEPGPAEPPQSPPLPSPHKPVAPGPRAVRLQQLFESSLGHMLNKISWENLEGCYPTVARGAPGMLKGVRKTMVERLEGMCKVRFPIDSGRGDGQRVRG